MHIIQSYWNPNTKEDVLLQTGGFVCPEIHWMAWAFSCLQLRKFYPNVELHTNKAGKELFELLGLPYTAIHTSMETDFMRNLHPSMWAYAKIHTYSLQTESFLHVDGDVFIWKAFDEQLMSSPLIAQNIEDNLIFYNHSIEVIEKHADVVPEWVGKYKHHPKAYNAGILGGNDIYFFKQYTQLALEYYQNNENKLNKMINEDSNVNTIPEQYLFYVLSQDSNVPVAVFSNKNEGVCNPDDFLRFVEISKIPYQEQYCHILGKLKTHNHLSNFVNFVLQNDYPQYWEHIIHVFKERGILSEYMQRLLTMQEKDKKTILPQIMPSKGTYRDTRTLCKLFDVAFDPQDLSQNFENPIIQDLYEYERKIHEFNNRTFVANHHSVPFPTYNAEGNVFNQKDYLDYYVYVTPYHQFVNTRYNWHKLFELKTAQEIVAHAYPYKLTTLLSLDGYYTLNDNFVHDALVTLIETIKLKPITIKELLKNDVAEKEKTLEMLTSWYSAGFIYLSKSKKDFIPQPPSEEYTYSQANLKNQVSTCLGYVLTHYGITNHDRKLLQKYQDIQRNVTMHEVVQTLEKIGLQAKGVRGNMDSLTKIPLPAICIVTLREYLPLYVVIIKSTATHITIYNTEMMQEENYPVAYFSTIWDGNLILVLPQGANN
ncbi:MAG TPA: cysteine peptidase family C39 domain-containing protein [Paludibacteraceae bacterium]|nr:cysteine peptidase family C39 domain-containing protein [Paludibacteraceae bacterium]